MDLKLGKREYVIGLYQALLQDNNMELMNNLPFTGFTGIMPYYILLIVVTLFSVKYLITSKGFINKLFFLAIVVAGFYYYEPINKIRIQSNNKIYSQTEFLKISNSVKLKNDYKNDSTRQQNNIDRVEKEILDEVIDKKQNLDYLLKTVNSKMYRTQID